MARAPGTGGPGHRGDPSSRAWALSHAAIWVTTFGFFALLPWSLEGKSLAVLHGLCAQQPGHSFYFGDARLPFDARMTGIYGGFVVTAALLLSRGRWRFGGIPPLKIVAALVAFVALMGIDGLNSTLRDFGLWHAYAPRNTLRLATGLLAGTALGTFIWLMVAQLAFAPQARHRRPSIANVRDVVIHLLALAAFAGVVKTGLPLLRVPVTLLLIASAVLVLTGLAFAFVLLLTRAEGRALSTHDLARPATLSLLIALILIGALSGGRFALEAWLGVPVATGSVR